MGDLSGSIPLSLDLRGSLRSGATAAPPPAIFGSGGTITGLAPLERHSAIYPAPILDAFGRPEGWSPTSSVDEIWGRYQVVFSGVDVTFFRGIPSLLGTMVFNEPFGDESVDIIFPQISPLEELGVGDLAWFTDGANVEIYHVLEDGSVELANPMFEGRYTTEETAIGARSKGTGQGGQQGSEQPAFAVTAHCLGAIYCADLCIRTPAFVVNVATDPTDGVLKAAPEDIGPLILRELNSRSGAGYVHLGTARVDNATGATGIVVSDPGSGTQLVNGYLQDLLAQGAVQPIPTAGSNVVAIGARPGGGGYWLAADDSSVLVFGARTFYGGSMVGTILDAPFADMAVTPSGLGYWLAAEDGGVFTFGDAGFHGSGVGVVTHTVVGIARTLTGLGYWLVTDVGGVFSFGDAVFHGSGAQAADTVGIAVTPDGLGYWLVDSAGHVAAYGSAVNSGDGSATGKAFVGIAARPSGGYWLATTDGHAYGYGAATGFVTPVAPAAPISDIVADDDGGVWLCGEDGGVFSLGDAVFHGSVPGADGQWEAWTISKLPGRIPIVRLKDRWTVHASMRVGQPGLQLGTLTRDYTTARDVIYGEGTDLEGHTWRNSKYPNLRPVSAPLWPLLPDAEIALGGSDPAVTTWSQAMHDAGWRVDVGSLFDGVNRDACQAFQLANGLTPTRTLNAQTWAATFVTGADNDNETGAYIAPLYEDPAVEPFLYDAFGGIVGANPAFDRSKLRVEGWETFGTGVEKVSAVISARAEIMRSGTPGYIGTVILYADPKETSRYNLRSGMNFLLEGLRGRDVLVHIAQASIAWNQQGRPVTLTVDEHAQDLITVNSQRSRDRSTTDPVRRQRHNRRASRIIPDRVQPWDFEAGGGIIPRFVLSSGTWSVVRVPAATAGAVIEAALTTDTPPSRFAVGIFNQRVTPAQIAAVIANPLADAGGGASAWNTFPATMGLVTGWGQFGQACGYQDPASLVGAEDAGSPLTGVFDDRGSWQFQSLIPPWLWVAIYAEDGCTVSGRLYPQTVDQ